MVKWTDCISLAYDVRAEARALYAYSADRLTGDDQDVGVSLSHSIIRNTTKIIEFLDEIERPPEIEAMDREKKRT